MVFQGTLLPAIGISLTPWTAQKEILLGVVVTLVAAFWLRWAALNGGLRVWHLFVNGALYVAYLTAVLV
jgi:cation:H+ antiporter